MDARTSAQRLAKVKINKIVATLSICRRLRINKAPVHIFGYFALTIYLICELSVHFASDSSFHKRKCYS
jgi:hypothetical protein